MPLRHGHPGRRRRQGDGVHCSCMQYRGRPQCALTSSQRFCARSSTVPEWPSRCNTVAQPLGWGHCYRRGLLAAGSTGGRSGGSGVRHDCGGCVMHPPSVAFRTVSAATDGAAALRQDVRSAEPITIWLRIGTSWCRPMATLRSLRLSFPACWVLRRWQEAM
jgi:hypothetical protein